MELREDGEAPRTQEEDKAVIVSGAKACWEKMRLNRHKRGYKNIDPHYCYSRAIGEMGELRDELFKNDSKERKNNKEIDFKAVRLEAADVCVMCFRIIFHCNKEIRKSKGIK